MCNNLILKAQPYGLTSHLTIYIITKFSYHGYVRHTHTPIIYTKRKHNALAHLLTWNHLLSKQVLY